jgi:hypothetical protein
MISYFLRVFKYDFSQWPKTLYNTYVYIIKYIYYYNILYYIILIYYIIIIYIIKKSLEKIFGKILWKNPEILLNPKKSLKIA